MKILFCASAASHIRNFHLAYFADLAALGYEIHVASEGLVEDATVAKSISLPFEKTGGMWRNLSTLFRLARLIRRERYQVVSTHAMLAGGLGRLAALLVLSPARVVHTCHGYLFDDDGSLRSRVMLLIEWLLGRRTNHLWVMNRQDYAIATRHHLCRSIELIHGMGLDDTRFPPPAPNQRAKLRQQLGLPGDSFVFLCVGEFSQRKSQEHLLRAFGELLQKQRPRPIRLLLAGDGALLERCKALSLELGIGGQTLFLGHCGQVASLYTLSDAVAAVSRYEGLPFNVLEALACGKPVVASRVKGHEDLIVPKSNGYLFEYGDWRELADCMERLMTEYFAVSLPIEYRLASVKPQLLSKYDAICR